MVNRPITEQLELWESIDVDVWQSAHVKTIRLPEKLSSLRQKLYHKAKQETQSAPLSSTERAKLLPAPEATGADIFVIASRAGVLCVRFG